MLIAQISDLHIGFDPDAAREANLVRLEAVLRRLRDGPNRPEALLMTGDLTENGDGESYARLAEAVAGLPFPVWPIPGNHDAREPLRAAFPQVPASGEFLHYALDFGDARVLMLDTLEPGRHGGGFCEARSRWLSAELAAHPDRPTLIAMHHPPFATGIAWLDCDENEAWVRRFFAAIRGHGQVRAIVSGHVHRAIHSMRDGTALTVCPSTAPLVALGLTGIDPDRPDGREMIRDEPPGFALHRWDGAALASHSEAVGAWPTLARFDAGMQAMVRGLERERRGG